MHVRNEKKIILFQIVFFWIQLFRAKKKPSKRHKGTPAWASAQCSAKTKYKRLDSLRNLIGPETYNKQNKEGTEWQLEKSQ